MNSKYTDGEKVPNPWHTMNYGPDGPVDYKDPQHFYHTGQDYINSREYIGKSNLLEDYDPEGILPTSEDDWTTGGFKEWVHATPASRARSRTKRPPKIDPVIPKNPPPRLKDLIHPPTVHPKTPHSEVDDPDQELFATGNADDPTDRTDYSLFATNSPADGATPSLNLFDGVATGQTDVTAGLDPSIFDNAGDLFDATSQADLTAFDPTSSSTLNVASIENDNSDWTSALLPSDGNSDVFSADIGGFTGDLFTAGNGDGGISDDLFIASNDNGGTVADDDNLFAKRYQRTSPRDYR